MKPFISIYLDRAYRLRLTYAVISEFEQLADKMIGETSLVDVDDLITLLWIMMRQDRFELTLETTVELLTRTEDRVKIFSSVNEAIRNSINKKATDAPGEPELFDIDGQLKIAAEIGIKPSDLYNMTPAEFDIAVDAYIKERKKRHNELYTQAWQTANFTRAKDLPGLDKYLVSIEKPTPPRELTTDEMLSACRTLCVAYSGTVIEE